MNAVVAHPSSDVMLSEALELATMGLAVFPLRGKKPTTAHGCKDATTAPDLIRRAWRAHPGANIGVATGSPSGVFVVDIDGPAGEAALSTLETAHGALPPTVEVRTGRGRHLYFEMPTGRLVANSTAKLGPKIDVRGEGGYVVAPPSVHPDTKTAYAYANEVYTFAAAPEWLLGLISRPIPNKPVSKAATSLAAAVAAVVQCPAPTPFELERLRGALAVIPLEDYETWTRVGMALHWLEEQSGEWSPFARSLWDESSRRSPKFDPQGQDKAWDSFGRGYDGPKVTLGTVFELAKRHGFAEPAFDPAHHGGTPASPPSPNGALFPAAPLVWPVKHPETGKPVDDERNVAAALQHMQVSVWFDAFNHTYRMAGLSAFDAGSELSDAAIREVRARLERAGLKIAREKLFDHVLAIGHRLQRHPVKDFIGTLRWDGVARLDSLLPAYFGAPDTPLVRSFGACVLIAAVRRVQRPGTKFDTMLVLEGAQGVGKSTALHVLAGKDWFSDALELGANPRVTIEQTAGKLIVEVSELNGIRSKDTELVKAQLARTVDRARLSYARAAVDVPRQFVLVGTTNSAAYLADQTGNRRFWPVRVGRIDLAGLRRDRDQLWAEAAVREEKGEPIHLSEKLWAAAAQEQDQRTLADPVRECLEELLDGIVGAITKEDVLLALGIARHDGSLARAHAQHGRTVYQTMLDLGWTNRKLTTPNGRRVNAWAKGDGSRWFTHLAGRFVPHQNMPPVLAAVVGKTA